MNLKWSFVAIALIASTSCMRNAEKKELPVLGAKDVVRQDENGENYIDTVYAQINDFSFTDQDSNTVTGDYYDGKVRVVDFFFTSCPTICPKMKKQMLRAYEEFEGNENVKFLSHSIDTRHDSVPVLNDYANKLGIEANRWKMVTGPEEDIYSIAEEYLVSAAEDSTAPGGYVHSGAFVLIDQNHRIRGYYDGTLPKDVDQMMVDIKSLLEEE